MEFTKSVCISCGAPVSVPQDAEEYTCVYCGIKMFVHRDEEGTDLRANEKANNISQTEKTSTTNPPTRSQKRKAASRNELEQYKPGSNKVKLFAISGIGIVFLVIGIMIANWGGKPSTTPRVTVTIAPLPTAAPMPVPSPQSPLDFFDSDFPLIESSTQTPGQPTRTPKPLEPTPVPIELKGTGQQATQRFNLQAGLAVFKMKHEGTRGFIVKVLDTNGNGIAWPANTIGTYDGSTAEAIRQSGTYLLDITASGAWTVTIEQPRVTKGVPYTNPYQGKGHLVSPIYHLEAGLKVITLSHTGKSNFIVELIDENGNVVEYLSNAIGNFQGTKAAGIKRTGNYLLNIQADGTWSINIEAQ